MLVGAITILAKTPFAYGAQYDGLLRLNLTNTPESQAALEKVLTTHCYNTTLVSLREMGRGWPSLFFRDETKDPGFLGEKAR